MNFPRIVVYRKPFGGPGGFKIVRITIDGAEIPMTRGIKVTDHVSDVPIVNIEMYGTVFYEDEEAE